MSKFTPEAGEAVLIDGKCLDLRQPIAYAGTMTITDRRVHFQPTRINRALGASPWAVPNERIDKLEMAGLQKCMKITTGDHTLSIIGKDVEVLYARLNALMHEQGMGGADIAEFEPGERILLRGTLSLVWNPLIWITGDYTLTTRRLRFVLKRRLERWLWRNQAFDEPVSTIHNVTLNPVRKRLELNFLNRKRIFTGPAIPRLYTFMNAINRDGNADSLIGCWTAQLHRGPLAQNGELLLSGKRILFISSGTVEAVMGTREELDIPLNQINRIQVDGTVDRRVVVQVGRDTHTFTLDNPSARVNDTVPLLMATDSPDDPEVAGANSTIDNKEAEALLEPWLDRLTLKPAPVKLAAPCVHVSSKPAVRRGWIILRAEEAIFVPGGSMTFRSRPVVISTLRLIPPLEGEERSPQLRLSSEGISLRVLPRGGEALTAMFWTLYQQDRNKVMKDAKKRQRERKIAMRERMVAAAGDGNRRETFRLTFPEPRPAQILIPCPSGEEVPRRINCGAVNLSEGGVCLGTSVQRPVESEFLVLLEPHLVPVPLPARVVHVRQVKKNSYQMGLEFVDLEIEVSLRVRAVVMQLQREELQTRADAEM